MGILFRQIELLYDSTSSRLHLSRGLVSAYAIKIASWKLPISCAENIILLCAATDILLILVPYQLRCGVICKTPSPLGKRPPMVSTYYYAYVNSSEKDPVPCPDLVIPRVLIGTHAVTLVYFETNANACLTHYTLFLSPV